jgi:uncharacterized protein (TIGR02246 family)
MKLKPITGYSIAVVALLTLALNGLALAASQRTKKSGLTPSDVEREIREVDRARAQALLRNDVEALARLYADDFVMITSTGQIRTKQDQLRDISASTIQHQAAADKILRLRVYGDVAVVQSESRGGLVMNGQGNTVLRRFTRIDVKRRGQWQLVATHISRVEEQK